MKTLLTSTIEKLNKVDKNMNTPVALPAVDSWPTTIHLFDKKSLWALKAAIAEERPLLVRGGTGYREEPACPEALHNIIKQ